MNPIGVCSKVPSSEQLPQPVDDIVTMDYSFKLKPGQCVRTYQEELAEPGINGENYIVVAPTGSGKTLVATLVISDHLKKNQHKERKPRVIFIVNTRPLAEQQKRELAGFIPNAKVDCSMGDDKSIVSYLLKDHDIVVCTAGKFLNAIKGNVDMFDMISLIVIDECHHTKKGTSQANIMVRYLEHKAKQSSKVPQIMGLTASPGAGNNPDLNQRKTIDHLVNLCAHMDATRGIITVKKNIDELDRHTNKPSCTLELTRHRDSNEPFIETIIRHMEDSEKCVPDFKCTFTRWSQEYETYVQQMKLPYELSTNPEFRDVISTLRILRCYCLALNVYMDLRCDDAIGVLQDSDDLPSDNSLATPHELGLKQNHLRLIATLKLLPPIENPLLKVAEEKLAETFSTNPDSKGIIFVRTKKHATSICKWLEELSLSSPYKIHPRVLMGHRGETGEGMTQVAQEEVMESFRKGACNVLVATSVAEEGLDVPACNLVIRFQHVSNEIAKAQTIGRARAEESEGLTILTCNSKKGLQEMKNTERLRLVDECMRYFPTGQHLVSMIKAQQVEIIKHHKQKLALRKMMRGMHDPSDVKLRCKTCKTMACGGSEIFLIAENHRTVPDEQFQNRFIKKPHPNPRPLEHAEDYAKTHKIFCKKCDSDWGVSAIWPTEGQTFPILKCKSFIFEVKGCPIAVKKWSTAPFDPSDISVWLEIHDNSDESDDE